MSVLFRLVLFAVIFYYAFKLLFRLLFPYVVKKSVENMEKKYNANQQETYKADKVGETVIDKRPDSCSATSDKQGEYIDYEEVD